MNIFIRINKLLFLLVKSNLSSCLSIGLVLLGTAAPSYSAAQATNVYFAGFALAGNAAETGTAFPITPEFNT